MSQPYPNLRFSGVASFEAVFALLGSLRANFLVALGNFAMPLRALNLSHLKILEVPCCYLEIATANLTT